ncbi:universal stress protein [Haloarchaeobius sp. HME9146]|uniref:universal stress protein n=1 Tax=Haloarchaeobius sp. HME9146 TaxID=2978732 RepID=UPI0021BE4DF0|nr:universal stress protein [Haloarchaeobius sp. HME9146]MCT9094889.1 universal stress protein [Haloarchaeobius sp. HME9146]
MYEHILLPTDGSDGTSAAAKHAAELASNYDATVHVLSVVDTRNRFESPSAGISAAVWEETERERAEAAVKSTIAALPDDVRTETVIREGVPKTAILEYVDENPIDLVVMATHGRTGLDHYLIGSVAEKVVRQCPAPVMTVREDQE